MNVISQAPPSRFGLAFAYIFLRREKPTSGQL
jgi:hypothetical protein